MSKQKTKKKIGIITYHNPCNYGATFQAYATVEYLKNAGFDPIIINYIPSSRREYGKIGDAIKTTDGSGLKKVIKGIIKSFSYRKMKRVFNAYSAKILPLTKVYPDFESLKDDVPDVDIFCSGSDQVWNNHYTKQFELAFFLDFVPENAKCFSFASSFGKSNFSEKENKVLREKLAKYDFITVREKDGLKILKKLGYKGKQLLDPTLMIPSDNWKKLVQPVKIKKKYVLVYQLHGDSVTTKLAKEYASKHNLEVVKINTMYHQARSGCKNILLPDFSEFMSLFKAAECVFTDSFHGTIFSLVFNKKFGVTLPHNFSNRVTSLLDLIKEPEFIVEDLDSWEQHMQGIDYSKINKSLDAVRSEKMQIIDDYLEKIR